MREADLDYHRRRHQEERRRARATVGTPAAAIHHELARLYAERIGEVADEATGFWPRLLAVLRG